MAEGMRGSGRFFRRRSLGALAAEGNSPEAAEDTDEGAALGAGVPFGRSLLPAAGAAFHGIVLVKFRHRAGQEVMLYRLILLISVAREMPSSMAARVRLPV
jgi:hypothetical protein